MLQRSLDVVSGQIISNQLAARHQMNVQMRIFFEQRLNQEQVADALARFAGHKNNFVHAVNVRDDWRGGCFFAVQGHLVFFFML